MTVLVLPPIGRLARIDVVLLVGFALTAVSVGCAPGPDAERGEHARGRRETQSRGKPDPPTRSSDAVEYFDPLRPSREVGTVTTPADARRSSGPLERVVGVSTRRNALSLLPS